jgi:hypothetical protein
MAFSSVSVVNSESQVHVRLVMGLVEYMKNNGWDVVHVAGVSGYQEPFEVGGYVPDVIAKRSDGLIAVGLAETCDVLSSEQTLKQFTAFSDLTTTDGKRETPFFVVVPESCIGELERILSAGYASRMARITRVKMAGI